MRFLPLLLALALSGCATPPQGARNDSDAPDPHATRAQATEVPDSYAAALRLWREPEQVNAWMGLRFEYDSVRALALSETQRSRGPNLAIHEAPDFYENPKGVCVDLSRFAVETLRTIAPDLKAGYLMIEFDPTTIRGNILRRHWVASFSRGGALYFFADSRRPGHIAGPYKTVSQYLSEYARYRGRRIVSYRELESFSRRIKQRSSKAVRTDG